jgi:hypothetical protein
MEWLTGLFILIFATWCGHEDGVTVKYEIRGKPSTHKVNLFCDKPDLRIPIYRRGDDNAHIVERSKDR